MSIPLVFEGNFTEKYLKMFHLPKIQFQPLHVHLMSLLPYMDENLYLLMLFFNELVLFKESNEMDAPIVTVINQVFDIFKSCRLAWNHWNLGIPLTL